MSRPQIDPREIQVWPLSQRKSELRLEDIKIDPSSPPPMAGDNEGKLDEIAKRISIAREVGASIVLTFGAHLIKNGAGSLVNKMIEGRWLTHIATQGAGTIHDWELAFVGETSERVQENARTGKFGSWEETGKWINLAVSAGAAEGLGYGEALGRFIMEDGVMLPAREILNEQIRAEPENPLTGARADLMYMMQLLGLRGGRICVLHPYKKHSVTAIAYEKGLPFTVHPGIGYDIICNHPSYNGGAIGRASTTDARIFAHSLLNLTTGVYLSIGSAVMSPQVFEKAFSLANNLLAQRGKPFIHNHTIVVVDLQDDGGWNWHSGEPTKDHPAYYLRFLKSFHRMGGKFYYLRADNRVVLHNLLTRLG